MGGLLSLSTSSPLLAEPTRPDTTAAAPPPARVVVAGASFAGLALTRQLLLDDGLCDVTVVEPRDFFEYTPGVLRCFVAPGKAAGLLVPLPATLGGGGGRVKWVRGWLSRVEEGKAIVTPHPPTSPGGPIEIPFDHLVLCTGSGYPGPIKAPVRSDDGTGAGDGDGGGGGGDPLSRAHRLETLATEAHKVAQARSTLILGGGTVGVELAAEIAWRYRTGVKKGGKQIVLVSRTPQLLPSLPPACGRAALRWLQARGVSVLLGDEVLEEDCGTGADTALLPGGATTGRGELRTRNGVRLLAASGEEGGGPSAWLVYRCTGPTPTAPAYLPSPGMEASAGGWLRTDGRLLLRARARRGREGGESSDGGATSVLRPLVLAAGDVLSLEEQQQPGGGGGGGGGDDKTAFAAELQGEAAATQILAAIRRARKRGAEEDVEERDHRYPYALVGDAQSPLIYCLSLGPYDGVLVFNDLVLAGPVMGRVAALTKHFIEVTKLWEATGVALARLFWLRIAHPLTFFLHRRVFTRRRRQQRQGPSGKKED